MEILEMLKWPIAITVIVLFVAYLLINKGLTLKSLRWKNWKLELGTTVFTASFGNHIITIRQENMKEPPSELISKLIELIQILARSGVRTNEFKRELALNKLDHTLHNIGGIESGNWQVTVRKTIVYVQGILRPIIEQLRENDEYVAVSSVLFWTNPEEQYSSYLKYNFDAAEKKAHIKRIMVLGRRDLVRSKHSMGKGPLLYIEEFFAQWDSLSKDYGASVKPYLHLKFLYFDNEEELNEFFKVWHGVGIGIRPGPEGGKEYTMVSFQKPPRRDYDVVLTVTIARDGDRSHVADIRHRVQRINTVWTTPEKGQWKTADDIREMIAQLNVSSPLGTAGSSQPVNEAPDSETARVG